jgi:hypothetical protein
VFDEPHTAISRPTALVIVTNDIVVCRVGIGGEIALDEISGFVGSEPEEYVKPVDVT